MKRLSTALLALVLSACAPFQEQPETPELADLATQIKTRLINEQTMDAAAVQVEHEDGSIYLRGYADSEAKKQRLEQIARDAAGDHPVVNQIEVK